MRRRRGMRGAPGCSAAERSTHMKELETHMDLAMLPVLTKSHTDRICNTGHLLQAEIIIQIMCEYKTINLYIK